MTSDANDDDKTVIQPPGSAPQTGFQKTAWVGPAGEPAALDKTQISAPPPPAPPAPHDDMGGNLPVGTRLGEFEITSLIGEGGFGIVYLAHDHSLQRRVALKEYMPSSLAQRDGGSQVRVKSARHKETFEAGLKSFINEARLLASFDHPSLVKVYRFWEANGTAYMVMPFLEGTTLKDVLKGMGQRPDETWLRSVLGPLTEALLVIHAEQCYHRDIAPDNVMLLPDKNRWLLLDFGAARRVIGDMTQALTVILKPGYAPVEQYAEIPGMKQGPWTDVYALAAVVYYAIMGKTPPPSVGRLLNDTYVPLSQAAAGRYSDGFLAAIDRALAVRPEERTQSIGQLRQELGLGEVVF
jgi:serine/threonine protein kinase